MSGARIGVVLPLREVFTQAKSGAVALCARDFARFSRYADRIDILGAGPCEYEEVAYRRVESWRRWWRRDRDAYADAVAALAPDYGLLEVQNRPYLMGRIRRRTPAAKLALHLHNDPQSMDGARSVEARARLLDICDAVFCVSEFIRQRFLQGVEDRQAKALTVYNGAPLPERVGVKAPIIAFTGRVAAIKGVVELARAYQAARPAGWRLAIAGDDRDGLLTGFAGEGVDLLGQVSHAEAMDLLARSEIAVVPSLWDDPCPRAAIEALAHGCALVTTRRGGLPEIAEGAAAFVDPTDIAAFAATLTRLAHDEGLRRDLQERGRARARERFEIGAATARLDAARASLLG